MANFEAFRWNISSSINLFFLTRVQIFFHNRLTFVFYARKDCNRHSSPFSYFWRSYMKCCDLCLLSVEFFRENNIAKLKLYRNLSSSKKCTSVKVSGTVIILFYDQTKKKCHTSSVGIQIQNMKMVFNIYGTWSRVMFEKLMMKIYDFFESAKSFSHPV